MVEDKSRNGSDIATSQGPSRTPEAKRGRKDLPLEPQRGHHPAHYLTLDFQAPEQRGPVSGFEPLSPSIVLC